MHIAVLGNAGSWYCRDLQRAASQRGHRLTRLDFRRLVGGLSHQGEPQLTSEEIDLRALDVLLVRTMPPGSLEQVIFRMDVLARLESAGVRVVNSPKALECAVDKYLTTSRLAAAGITVPDTFVCENAEDAMQAFETLGGDVVVKPIFGSEGRGIVRVSDPDLAQRTFRTLERIQSVLYVQRFIEHDGFDIRVLVLDGKPLGGIRRHGDDDFRTNVARNGQAALHQPTDEEQRLAVQSSATVGTRIAGVDLLYDRQGICHVIEVNAVPGWRAFSKITTCDVAAHLIESLERDPAPDSPNDGSHDSIDLCGSSADNRNISRS